MPTGSARQVRRPFAAPFFVGPEKTGQAEVGCLASAGFELEFGVESRASTRNLASY